MGKTKKNSAVNKADLARAGTMELTSKEGRAYLEKNLTEWKKPLLLGEKTALSDDTADNDNDADVEPPSAKKAKLSKATTMDATTKEGKALLGGKKLGDTRQVTKAAQKKAAMKRAGTMQQAVAEAVAVYGGDLAACGSRFTTNNQQPAGVAASTKKTKTAVKKRTKKAKTAKKSPAKKAAKKGTMKKYGTMFKTAKEAKQLLGGEKLGDTRQVTKAKQGTK